MNQITMTIMILIPSLLFLGIAFMSNFNGATKSILQLSKIASVAGIIVSAIAIGSVISNGQILVSLFESNGLGISFRLDALSLSMYGMIAIISFVILKYSRNYLDGDPRQGIFFGRIALTIASVQLLVISGNLAILFISWVLTSIFLHRLLIFYKDRPRAVTAARKKFIVARIADLCLLAASVILYNQFGTGDLEGIFEAIKAGGYTNIELPAILLAIAAIFKSAQLPFHSWLLEVMETPTPVSALLHAGLLNAGPFLLIRMAFVIQESSWAPVLLITVGGLTAAVASVIYMTQNSVKTALAYSSMAHMGFSLMSCGLGVFGAAMLHLMAHSFYKAHAFLSSGSIIFKIKEQQYKLSEKIGSTWRIALGIVVALGIYLGTSLIWGINPLNELPILAIGAVISLGTAHLFTSIITKKNALQLLLGGIGLSLLINFSFFTFESSTYALLSNQIPAPGVPSLAVIIAAAAVLILFTAIIFIQMSAPFLAQKAKYQHLSIHLRNGLYMNIWFDKVVGAHRIKLRPVSTLQYIESQRGVEHQEAQKQSTNIAERIKEKLYN